ncbi:tRNA threonylcarbamoyladenosine biosynthesis protein TsaB [Nitrosospira multiformis]|uniref:tRNA threonylcarbamoyladenosine biosynthesis protein TsaB n=1 Tax=Nitrosospira multiformis TaxID=1231 RepID=A0A2T5IGY5_9PROT|nr:tRNA (adenosine(37)-N6)-threonylcarbamoyltransferase complex dimerization subunit type 1 TsaB [Nitrosospira multiformis]PTQ83090.1 tRNA threonylcarbamoyladenosine biosynthesis protein TsaB [Nitrosospira multiformis]
MKILAFDTSSEYCSVALLLERDLLGEEVLAGQRHSELVLPMVSRILDESGLTLVQLDGIAFGSGPGSFTGLRIACGIAQGLAFGAGLPVIGIGTLEALAQQAGGTQVITALDARMHEIYHAAYRKGLDGWQAVSEPILCLPQNAPPLQEQDWTGCGSGFDMYPTVLRKRYEGYLNHIISGVRPDARAMTQLAAPRFARGQGLDPADAAPLYIRNKVALKEKER